MGLVTFQVLEGLERGQVLPPGEDVGAPDHGGGTLHLRREAARQAVPADRQVLTVGEGAQPLQQPACIGEGASASGRLQRFEGASVPGSRCGGSCSSTIFPRSFPRHATM